MAKEKNNMMVMMPSLTGLWKLFATKGVCLDAAIGDVESVCDCGAGSRGGTELAAADRATMPFSSPLVWVSHKTPPVTNIYNIRVVVPTSGPRKKGRFFKTAQFSAILSHPTPTAKFEKWNQNLARNCAEIRKNFRATILSKATLLRLPESARY